MHCPSKSGDKPRCVSAGFVFLEIQAGMQRQQAFLCHSGKSAHAGISMPMQLFGIGKTSFDRLPFV